MSHNPQWSLREKEVRVGQDLKVRVWNLRQNQNNLLQKNILLMLITEHEE